MIDAGGTVGSVIDIRNPAQPPRGQHWLNEPQHTPVTAGEVGQVFGVTLNDAQTPNVYLTATSAFGLHRTPDNADWMKGMWGPDGGPGAVWMLDAANDYQPSLFANITLDGRENTGAALGNIAFDKTHLQLYVSDLETGMIHRLSIQDGSDLGHFDHGVTGRASFVDAATGAQGSLPQVSFDPKSAAKIKDCPSGDFSKSPECWNFADFRRRVWGLGVREDAEGAVRLYYAVWSSQGFGNPDYAGASDEEKRNSVWSVAITEDGDFDASSVRREFFLPDFFTDPADIARAGRSNPVSDIAFPECIEQNVMLVAERGGVRNLGLDAEEPFAYPHEARVLRYELDEKGVWQPIGRYDVGFYDRKNERAPFLRANSSGGADFGYGYNVEWAIDLAKPDQFVWMTGDSLCSPFGPCYVPDTGKFEDGSQVHGAQGTPEFGFDQLLPEAATQAYPTTGEAPYPATGPSQSWMIDTDINVDANGAAIMKSLAKNDATKIGDIAIYEDCEKVGEEGEEEDEEVPAEGEVPAEVLPPGVETPPEPEFPPIEEGPDLSKDKTGPAECIEGGICTFTITITNNGPGIWDGPLWEVETLPPGSILWDYAPQPDWICNQPVGSDNVYCMHAWVTLLPGESVTLTKDVLLPFGNVGEMVENCIYDIWLPSTDMNDPATILVIEQALAALGYAVGPIDGILDAVTMAAIAQWQADNGFPPDGLPNADQMASGLLFPGSAAWPGDYNPDNDWDCHQVLILPAPIPVTPATPLTPIPPAVPPVEPIEPVQPLDLEIKKDQLIKNCLPNELCQYSVTIINHGPGTWNGTPIIKDELPIGATFVGSSGWICGQTSNKLSCESPSQVSLAPGDSRTVIITLKMPETLPDGVKNCVEIVVTTKDQNPDNDRVCDPVVMGGTPPDLVPLKVQTTPTCQPGNSCSFDLWFINRGPGSWTGRPTLTDKLPEGASLQSGKNCRQSGSTVTCSGPQTTLPAGKGMRFSVVVKLPQDLKHGAKNCLIVEQGTKRDPIPQNDQTCIPISIPEPAPEPTPEPTPTPDIRIEKSQVGTCKAGGICVFEIKFINEGPGSWSGKPRLSEQLQSGATASYAFPTNWHCKSGGGRYACEHDQVSLNEGESISIVVTMKMPANVANGTENCASLDTPVVGPRDNNPSNDEHCVPMDVTPPSQIYTPHPPTTVIPEPVIPETVIPQPVCPPGTHLEDGYCVSPIPEWIPIPETGCPPGTHLEDHHCVRPCPPGTVRRGNHCVRIPHCPPGSHLEHGHCVKHPERCPPGTIKKHGECVRITEHCQPGFHFENGHCVKTGHLCGAGEIRRGDRCVKIVKPCPRGTVRKGNACVRKPIDHVKPHDHKKPTVKPKGHKEPKVKPHGHKKPTVKSHGGGQAKVKQHHAKQGAAIRRGGGAQKKVVRPQQQRKKRR